MPTYNEIESAWGPNEDEINTVAERALLLKVVGKIPAQPEPPPSTVLFHPDLVDSDFGSHLLSVAKLIKWADQLGLEVATQPPLDQFQFVQVEALLCAIERAAIDTTTEPMAVAIVQATPCLAHDEAAEIAPRWLIAADAHKQWRHLIAHAVAMHELVLLHFGSKLPVQPLNETEPQAAPVLKALALTANASGTPASQGNIMKKSALIAMLKFEWPSIDGDMREATRNELNTDAHTEKHGMWNSDNARAWAVSRGKIKGPSQEHSLASVWLGTTRRHTISG